MGVITQESYNKIHQKVLYTATYKSCAQSTVQRMNSYSAPIIDWWPERDLHPAQGNRDRQKSGCSVSSQSCSKPDQTQDDSDLQLWYSTRARKYSLYSYLDTSGVEEEGAVHSKTTAAERSQESRVQPSFKVLCCKKTKQNNKPKPKQNNSTRPSPNATLPLYCSQNKTT